MWSRKTRIGSWDNSLAKRTAKHGVGGQLVNCLLGAWAWQKEYMTTDKEVVVQTALVSHCPCMKLRMAL